jgi:hypothetical protein
VQELRDDARPTPNVLLPRVLLLAVLAAVAVVLVLVLDPIPQSPDYHKFADYRTLFGVPHCCNVLSNVPFLLVGALGVWSVLRSRVMFQYPAERWAYVVFFLGVGATAFGSAYYHLDPDNDGLLWDRLPMAVAFMSLFSAIVAERISLRAGVALLPVLVAAGLASVLYWHWTERQGRGDLRFYYLVQFYPLLILPLVLLFFPSRYTGTADLLGVLGWYVLAKVLEHPFDATIYGAAGVSGHTLKHLAAAMAAFWVLAMLWRRRPVPSAGS